MRDSKIYNKHSGCVYIKLERLGNFQNMYSKIYNFTDKCYAKLCYRIDYKYIYRKRILKILDNIFYLMENNNIEFKFNLFDYDLYEVTDTSDLYIIKIKLKKEINNIINKEIDIDKIENNNKYNNNYNNNIDIDKIENNEKEIKAIGKTMYIFHSYKKMFYYSLR